MFRGPHVQGCRSCHNTVHLGMQETDCYFQLRMLEQTMCGICWCPLVAADEFKEPVPEPVLNNCGHVFHCGCLDSRLQFCVTSPLHCPLCGSFIMETKRIHVVDTQYQVYKAEKSSSRRSSGYESPSFFPEMVSSVHLPTQQQMQFPDGTVSLDRQKVKKKPKKVKTRKSSKSSESKSSSNPDLSGVKANIFSIHNPPFLYKVSPPEETEKFTSGQNISSLFDNVIGCLDKLKIDMEQVK